MSSVSEFNTFFFKNFLEELVGRILRMKDLGTSIT